jgi:hypothetical protein
MLLTPEIRMVVIFVLIMIDRQTYLTISEAKLSYDVPVILA